MEDKELVTNWELLEEDHDLEPWREIEEQKKHSFQDARDYSHLMGY